MYVCLHLPRAQNEIVRLPDLLALARDFGRVVVQCDKDDCSDMKIVKVDLPGLA